ncbi:hypothetical protein NP233_g3030 [Leucocoprinus birnbaumii]|uniref:Uncharacterized protein n=1 Tax=Leucocoprinus birnbaumii TaxID=56174 RepID=A0AAD5YY96_9AGAR|nr:hypothetical protein NP233_g3030 [Leucocoprinus birnbaumii]
MHHRALRHLSPPPTYSISQWTPGNGPSFIQVLQAAASQAWVRRVSSHTKTSSNARKSCISPSSQYHKSHGDSGPRRRSVTDKLAKRCLATRAPDTLLRIAVEPEMEETRIPDSSIPPTCNSTLDSLNNWDVHTSPSKLPHTCHEVVAPVNDEDNESKSRPVHYTDGRTADSEADVHRNPEGRDNDTREARNSDLTPSSPRTKSRLISQAPISRHFPKPRTRGELLENLRRSLYLKPLPPFPALIDYHDSNPTSRSTQTYNFLIELSIRHAQYGTTRWLFDAMTQDNLPRDSVTRLLEVRFFVRTGKWETAWSLVTGLSPEEALDQPLRNGRAPTMTKAPVELWKELIGTGKQGAIRRLSDIQWGTDEDGNEIRLPPIEIVRDPILGTEAYERRRLLLGCIEPAFSKSGPVRPQLIKYIVLWMIADGRRPEAETFAKSYLSQLPSFLQGETTAQCMDIIHVLLCRNPQDGSAAFNKNRKILSQLLKTHPSLKPSSTTLRLILAPLKKVTNCATVALRTMKEFQKEWGDQVADSSVRRRVIRLAEKQGRMDIVEKMLLLEQETPKTSATSCRLAQGPEDSRGFRRQPDRELFPRLSVETGQWIKLRLRLRRKQQKGDRKRKSE